MSQVSPVLRVWKDMAGVQRVLYWCAGCKHAHHVPTDAWKWNGNTHAPTLHPSVRHYFTRGKEEVTICHYFVEDGHIRYLEDCQHELKAKRVKLPELPSTSEYGYPDER